MEFEWDEGKDAANRAKHGVSLAEAARMDWTGISGQDLRHDYGEERFLTYLLQGNRLYICIFALRNGSVRIISLRKANAREERRYGTLTAT